MISFFIPGGEARLASLDPTWNSRLHPAYPVTGKKPVRESPYVQSTPGMAATPLRETEAASRS